MTGRLEGKVAFITGAARGQGRAHAVKLAGEGADIIAIDIAGKLPDCAPYPSATQEDLDETVRLVEATGQRILASAVDTRDHDGLCKVVADGVAELGRLDVIVANAGISAPSDVERDHPRGVPRRDGHQRHRRLEHRDGRRPADHRRRSRRVDHPDQLGGGSEDAAVHDSLHRQ